MENKILDAYIVNEASGNINKDPKVDPWAVRDGIVEKVETASMKIGGIYISEDSMEEDKAYASKKVAGIKKLKSLAEKFEAEASKIVKSMGM
jgi:hypothetical protein